MQVNSGWLVRVADCATHSFTTLVSSVNVFAPQLQALDQKVLVAADGCSVDNCPVLVLLWAGGGGGGGQAMSWSNTNVCVCIACVMCNV